MRRDTAIWSGTKHWAFWMRKYRTVVILYYVEGFKMSEIAQILDIPEATVRTRIARARKTMAKEYYPEAERRRLI